MPLLFVPFGQDVELLEEGLVVAALGRVVGLRVDLRDVLGQFECHSELLSIENHPPLGFRQGLLGGVYLGFQPCPLVAEGIGRHIVALLGVQANKAHLLILELGDQGSLGLLHFGDGLLADTHQGLDGLRAALHVLGAQLDRPVAVVAADGTFDQLGADVGAHGALAAIDPAGTEEIGVLASVLAGGQAEGQALAAFAAEHRAAQVVLAMLRALPGHPLFVKSRLYGIEGVLVDQRLMAAGESLLVGSAALVDDPSGVVRVAQDALERRGADLLAANVSASAASPQAEPVQLFGQLRHRVFATGVQLEGNGDEVLAIRVGGNAGYLAAVRQHFRRIDVADARPAVGTAVFGLLENAAFDALAALDPGPGRSQRSSTSRRKYVAGLGVAGLLLLASIVLYDSFESTGSPALAIPNGCAEAAAQAAIDSPPLSVNGVAKLYVFQPESTSGSTQGGWTDYIENSVEPNSQLKYALIYFNEDSQSEAKPNAVARIELADSLRFVPDSTCVYKNDEFTSGTRYMSSDLVNRAGLPIGDLRRDSNAIVTFTVEIPELDSLKCGRNSTSVYGQVATKGAVRESAQPTRIWSSLTKTCS